ncbi:MAG TPA: alcohol dehydrogenase catalytic domain-containing protein [Dictyoglomaceae bacterium]|nr:alcohol dehydrogenase catalytic domain-containing protein [Dictyoglomaceae bacterium]HOL39054.1 alcohol dehydrogenase catalytic domain-containing protein [Dictyoglomaceae bacterium]HOP94393.1 alcohol dehydrogenase catalytic domain-containing protein [Dictyoglomaceae bacterium]HPP15770.1 alcohol dehydrogenase catalytic domain-containing protein [Dictyoglomaceae bacterium]HPU42759.1 alcohol dehydrogenase catalytic domain-containing protein [Dictyoglomaceae bacterium]
MKAVWFEDSVPRYALSKVLGNIHSSFYYNAFSCLRYGDFPEPKLPGPKWVKIKTLMGGICGSDIGLIRLHDSLSTSSFTSFPFVIGHENLGVIVEKGEEVENFEIGDRVIVDPVLSCYARDIDPPCEKCQNWEFSQCMNFTEGSISPGLMIGACRDTGGSWGEYYVAHEFQLFKVPDKVTNENAILVDAFCSALHPVMRNFPKDSDTVLVAGAGSIGINVISSLRTLGSKARIIALARYKFQGELAKYYGADEVIYTKGLDTYTLYEKVAEVTSAKVLKPILGKPVMIGGADVVYECVGSDSSIDDALRFTKQGGKLVLVGLVGVTKNVDWTFVWFKELKLAGTNSSSGEIFREERKRGYGIALQLMEEGLDLSQLLTHTFDLKDYRKAIEMNFHRGRFGVVKSAFVFK